MINRHSVEAVDRTFRDLLRCDSIFGGKCIVMGGDFRQILPVVPKGGRTEIVDATLNTSALWHHCTLLELKQNMRIQSSNDPVEQGLIKEFTE